MPEKGSREDRKKRELDERLDRELAQSFPASDPPKVTLGVSAKKPESRRGGSPAPKKKAKKQG
ncbi:MAG TPA: hypothetical protein VKZ85_06165 [Woeseiaceae bacterium]|nr:hypothetical protein [Woeseiaceae bacterium]